MGSTSSSSISASAFNVFVSRKLEVGEDSNNYITWKEQMLCLIESEDLLGFINGEVAPPSQDYVVWRRSDRRVKGWILGALSDQLIQSCVGLDTARDVWLILENMFTQPPPANDQDKDYHEYLALYKAALTGDWDTAKSILEQDPEAAEARVASTLETALHVAVGTRVALEFVANLVQAMSSDEVLALKDRLGRNALHTAALTGNTAAAKVLVGKAPALLYVADHKALFPIHLAARSGHRGTLEFLISQTKDNFMPNPFADASGVSLLCFVIDADFYDTALRLVEKYPHLARMKNDESNRWGLERISNKEFAFPSGAEFSLVGGLIYSRIQPEMESEATPQSGYIENPRSALGRGIQMRMLPVATRPTPQSSDIENPFSTLVGFCYELVQNLQFAMKTKVPIIRWIHRKKIMHQQAIQLVKCLCKNMVSLKENEARSLYSSAVMTAARLGIPEVIQEILETFPGAVHTRRDGDGYDIFQVAITNRNENVFKLIHRTKGHIHRYSDVRDSCGNTILHLVARLAPPHKLNLVHGAALQMQHELIWFKEMEKFVHPYVRELVNDDGRTPKMLFTEEHRSLKAEGEKWIKDTANASIISSALIASVAFAAAITVPGANNSSTGYPMFYKSSAFTIFGVSNAICLFTSLYSLLVFLRIMTLRYAEEDFRTFLPSLLFATLFTSFFSIFCMMVAFAASTYLMLGQVRALVLIPVALSASIPFAPMIYLQIPLILKYLASTHGGRHIHL